MSHTAEFELTRWRDGEMIKVYDRRDAERRFNLHGC
jgi:hypothetical protein